MAALLMDAVTQAAIADLAQRAAAKPIPLAEIRRMAEGFDPGDASTRPGRESVLPLEFTIDVPFGYRMTLTFEEQPDGLCRHLSVSRPATARVPHPLVVLELAFLCGFRAPQTATMWVEEYAAGFRAVNLLEPVTARDSLASH